MKPTRPMDERVGNMLLFSTKQPIYRHIQNISEGIQFNV